MEEVAGYVSPVERALAGWLVERPVSIPRLPVALLSDEQAAHELQRVQARKAMEAAYEAELVLRLAEARPANTDPVPGTLGARRGSWAPEPELPEVSEFFTAELAVVLTVGRGTASHLAHRAWVYRSHLPAPWAALAAGTLDEVRARALVDVLEHHRRDRPPDRGRAAAGGPEPDGGRAEEEGAGTAAGRRRHRRPPRAGGTARRRAAVRLPVRRDGHPRRRSARRRRRRMPSRSSMRWRGC
ncbi:hypothetical protein ACI79J_12180 [Geodermatophilus sp. SYSU D01062]